GDDGLQHDHPLGFLAHAGPTAASAWAFRGILATAARLGEPMSNKQFDVALASKPEQIPDWVPDDEREELTEYLSFGGDDRTVMIIRNGERIATHWDGGEAEDNSFGRDWSWIVGELRAASDAGAESQRDTEQETSELHEQLAAMHEAVSNIQLPVPVDGDFHYLIRSSGGPDCPPEGWHVVFGGPYQSYTIPTHDNNGVLGWYYFDHDEGRWREYESLAARVVFEDFEDEEIEERDGEDEPGFDDRARDLLDRHPDRFVSHCMIWTPKRNEIESVASHEDLVGELLAVLVSVTEPATDDQREAMQCLRDLFRSPEEPELQVKDRDESALEQELRRAWGDDVTIAHADGPHISSTTITNSAGQVLFSCDGKPRRDRIQHAI